MSADAATATPPIGPQTPAPLAGVVRWRIFLYAGVLIILLGFGSPGGGVIGLPVSFFLKNRLHLKAHEVATFALITHIPVYLSFAFGFARDSFNPFGMRDRGFMVLFGTISAAIYLFFAFTPPTYLTLLAAMVMLYTSFLFILAAQRGLMSTLGQQHVMSGQVSAAINTFDALPGIAALLVGGVLSDQMEGQGAGQAARLLFLVGAAIMGSLALYGLWRACSTTSVPNG
jgi:MFS family permease